MIQKPYRLRHPAQPNWIGNEMKTTIQGYTFEISETYTEGAVVNAIEANALNQLRAGNIGNNFRKRVQGVIESQPSTSDEDGNETRDTLTNTQVADLQKDITEYDGEYTLAAVRSRGQRDPVVQMARTIARAVIEKEVKANSHNTLKSWKDSVGDEVYNAKIAEVAANRKVVALAKRSVELSF